MKQKPVRGSGEIISEKIGVVRIDLSRTALFTFLQESRESGSAGSPLNEGLPDGGHLPGTWACRCRRRWSVTASEVKPSKGIVIAFGKSYDLFNRITWGHKMYFRALVASLFSMTVSAFAVDSSFQLVKQDDKVSVYSKRPENCVSDGASVLFVVENRTKERLELKLELLNMKVKNRLTVLVEPSGNTSVLSLSPDAEACHTELVDMKVNSMASKPDKATALDKSEKPIPVESPAGSNPAEPVVRTL